MKIKINGERKVIDSIYIMSVKGGSWKEGDEGWIADSRGDIDRKFYEKTAPSPTWVKKTGEILDSSSGGTYLNYGDRRTFSPGQSTVVRPTKLLFDFNAMRTEGISSKLQLKIYHSMDGVNWTEANSDDVTVSTDNYYPYDTILTMDGQTDCKYIQYRITHISSSGSTVWLGVQAVKCIEWYEQE